MYYGVMMTTCTIKGLYFAGKKNLRILRITKIREIQYLEILLLVGVSECTICHVGSDTFSQNYLSSNLFTSLIREIFCPRNVTLILYYTL